MPTSISPFGSVNNSRAPETVPATTPEKPLGSTNDELAGGGIVAVPTGVAVGVAVACGVAVGGTVGVGVARGVAVGAALGRGVAVGVLPATGVEVGEPAPAGVDVAAGAVVEEPLGAGAFEPPPPPEHDAIARLMITPNTAADGR